MHFFIQWDATNNCNLRCSHCYHNSEETPLDIMSDDEAIRMIDDLVSCCSRWGFNSPSLHYSGGEPLLRESLFEIADYGNKKGLRQKILTNGTLMTREIAKKLVGVGIDRAQISIDGDRETHNKIRGFSWAYDKAMDGVTNATLEGMDINTSTTLMQSNKNQMEDIIINSYKAGASKVAFQSLVPTSIDDLEFIGANEVHKIYKEIHNLREKYKDKILVLETEVLWNILHPTTIIKERSREMDKYGGGCSAGFNSLSVLSDGTVYPCRRLPVNIGHISEGISKLFMESEIMDNLRDYHNIKGCGDCEMVTYCRGCRAIAYAVTGDYMGKDPMCFKDGS